MAARKARKQDEFETQKRMPNADDDLFADEVIAPEEWFKNDTESSEREEFANSGAALMANYAGPGAVILGKSYVSRDVSNKSFPSTPTERIAALAQKNGLSIKYIIGAGAFGTVFALRSSTNKDAESAGKVVDIENERRAKGATLLPFEFSEACKQISQGCDNLLTIKNVIIEAKSDAAKFAAIAASMDGCRSSPTQLAMLVTELCHCDLAIHIQSAQRQFSCPATFDACRSLTVQLLSAVSHLHKMHYVHTDVKPQNIFMYHGSRDWIFKLGDFGECVNESMLSVPPKYVTTRYYRAPELVLGKRADRTIDLWSAGCCILEFLTTVTVFPARDGIELIDLILGSIGMPPGGYLETAEFADVHFSKVGRFSSRNEDFGDACTKAVQYHGCSNSDSDSSSSSTCGDCKTNCYRHCWRRFPLPTGWSTMRSRSEPTKQYFFTSSDRWAPISQWTRPTLSVDNVIGMTLKERRVPSCRSGDDGWELAVARSDGTLVSSQSMLKSSSVNTQHPASSPKLNHGAQLIYSKDQMHGEFVETYPFDNMEDDWRQEIVYLHKASGILQYHPPVWRPLTELVKNVWPDHDLGRGDSNSAIGKGRGPLHSYVCDLLGLLSWEANERRKAAESLLASHVQTFTCHDDKQNRKEYASDFQEIPQRQRLNLLKTATSHCFKQKKLPAAEAAIVSSTKSIKRDNLTTFKSTENIHVQEEVSNAFNIHLLRNSTTEKNKNLDDVHTNSTSGTSYVANMTGNSCAVNSNKRRTEGEANTNEPMKRKYHEKKLKTSREKDFISGTSTSALTYVGFCGSMAENSQTAVQSFTDGRSWESHPALKFTILRYRNTVDTPSSKLPAIREAIPLSSVDFFLRFDEGHEGWEEQLGIAQSTNSIWWNAAALINPANEVELYDPQRLESKFSKNTHRTKGNIVSTCENNGSPSQRGTKSNRWRQAKGKFSLLQQASSAQ